MFFWNMRRFAQFGSIYTIYSRLCVFFMFFKIAQKVPNHPKHHIKFYINSPPRHNFGKDK